MKPGNILVRQRGCKFFAGDNARPRGVSISSSRVESSDSSARLAEAPALEKRGIVAFFSSSQKNLRLALFRLFLGISRFARTAPFSLSLSLSLSPVPMRRARGAWLETSPTNGQSVERERERASFVRAGRDHTAHALVHGTVAFSRTGVRKGKQGLWHYRQWISVVPHAPKEPLALAGPDAQTPAPQPEL